MSLSLSFLPPSFWIYTSSSSSFTLCYPVLHLDTSLLFSTWFRSIFPPFYILFKSGISFFHSYIVSFVSEWKFQSESSDGEILDVLKKLKKAWKREKLWGWGKEKRKKGRKRKKKGGKRWERAEEERRKPQVRRWSHKRKVGWEEPHFCFFLRFS